MKPSVPQLLGIGVPSAKTPRFYLRSERSPWACIWSQLRREQRGQAVHGVPSPALNVSDLRRYAEHRGASVSHGATGCRVANMRLQVVTKSAKWVK